MTQTGTGKPIRRIARHCVAVCVIALKAIGMCGAPSDEHVSFQRLLPRDGLPAAVVYCGVEDSRGFLWFGTANGVARYDGAEFRVFLPDPEDPGSLLNGAVLSIKENADGDLWMASEGGLVLWRRDTERFTHYRHDPNDPTSLSDDTTQSLLLDDDGRLWVGTTRGGLNLFDPKTGRFRRFGVDLEEKGGVSGPWIRCLFRDSRGTLWVGTGNEGLNRLDSGSDRFRVYRFDASDRRSLNHDRVSAVVEDAQGELWIGTDGGLCRFDRERDDFERVTLEPPENFELPNQSVTAIAADTDGSLWFGTDGAGLCRYEPSSGSVLWHRNSKYLDSTLLTNAVRMMFEDINGDLWVGHFPAGVSHMDRLGTAFQVFVSVPGETNTLSDDNVLSFLEDPSGDLWVGTDNGGVNHWSAASGLWTSYRHSSSDPASLGGKAAVHLHRDRRGQLWVGTWDGGLNRFEAETGTFRRYLPNPARSDSLSDAHAWRIAEDLQGRLWVATIGGGVNRYLPETDGFIHYRHDPENARSLNDDIVSSLLVTRDGALWAGTPQGLARWSQATDDWDRFQTGPGQPGTLNGYWVFDLLEDRDGMIWATTEGGGLNRLNPSTGEVASFRVADGLPTDVLRGIMQADDGALWVGSNRGLIRIEPDRFRVRVFDESNGLPSAQLNPHARTRLAGGDFLFGTTRGFVRFDPNYVPINARPPPVVLTEFDVFNQSVRPGKEGGPLLKSITETKRLEIPAGLSVISFQFAALSYRSPSRTQYRFMLEGFDEGWREPGAERRATFTNLDPGHYRLRVKAANGDGVWNEEGVSLELIVIPPWWRTPWFLSVAVFVTLACAATVGWAISRQHQRKRELEIERERVREREEAAEALRALNQDLERRVCERTSQLVAANRELEAFAYSVSHDLRAPLRHVDGFMELLVERTAGTLDAKAQRYMDDISNAAKRMGRLIDDLLAFSRMGRREMMAGEVDLGALVKEVIEDFAPDFGNREIEWKVASLPVVQGDRSMLRLALQNLVSNAVKFTRPRSRAVIEIGFRDDGNGPIFFIKDNGVGFDREYTKNLFGVFQRLHREDEFEGTGIGLANVRRVIERHGGSVWADGDIDKGATFYFKLNGNKLSKT